MTLLDRLGTKAWARSFRPVNCHNPGCSRWLTMRQLEVRRVGVTFADRWYCGYRCFRPAAQRFLSNLLRNASSTDLRSAHSSLGLALVQHGLLSDVQYKTACRIERETEGEIGEIVVGLGFVSEREVTNIRARQWSCPIYPCSTVIPSTDLRLPSLLVQRYGMLPLDYAADRLFVGFSGDVVYEALYAIESILRCSTSACVILPSEFKCLAPLVTSSQENLEESFKTVAEMTEAICKRGVSMNADQVTFARCGDAIWCRIGVGLKSADLVFRSKDFMKSRLQVDLRPSHRRLMELANPC